MAANKFATMLHRNTDRVSLVLVYAVLEWILIALLLLNSVFSYLIVKFAQYFGLKTPCLWCTRLDHMFDPAKREKNVHRDLLCEVHSKEVSNLGFCSNHQRLVEYQDMCEDCLSSRPEFKCGSKNFLSFVKDFCENDEVNVSCSCCGVVLDRSNNENHDVYSSYVLLKTLSSDVLECAHKENSAADFGENLSDSATDLCENEMVFEYRNKNQMLSELEEEKKKEAFMEESVNMITKDKSVQVCVEEDGNFGEISSQHLEFFLDYSGHRLVPIELVDSITEENQSNGNIMFEDFYDTKVQDFGLEGEFRVGKDGFLLDFDINEDPKFEEEFENSADFRVPQFPYDASEFQELEVIGEETCPSILIAFEEVAQMGNNENEADISIGTEIPDLDITDEIQNQESFLFDESINEGPSKSSLIQNEEEPHVTMKLEEQVVNLKPLSSKERDHVLNNQPSVYSDLCEIEEDKVPYTPTSMDSLNHLHKKILLQERKDPGTEESFDGSVTSELDGGDGVVTVERLKAMLRADRKTLLALYAELEEERSASATAANQTMAMINRLQEEKAAMQMEALQYQRMMEEQSEYDQEALELLNELMVKKEKEKLEVEKEFEVCRKKLLDYETKQKIMVLKRSKNESARSGHGSGSCSNSEDSDGSFTSLDLNREAKVEEGFNGNQEYTPADAVVSLEESLADFEDERFSILEQLKILEEKLGTMDDDKGQRFEDVRDMEDSVRQENYHSNGFMINGKHDQQSRISSQKGKMLLPLFEEISDEKEDEMLHGNINWIESNGLHDAFESTPGMEDKNLAIEEEVDHLYERLQAFEADREFLKHCISSLNKGEKGMDLLQEILHHLRDLRNVELRSRNLSGNSML
ncbi:myosin-binding protein 2-like [Primulina tabacum]|uniref:myosin-binding protein 2-like n=1 Tax=Primulina tabacum TaxID=48773 RepID=UPI003F5AC0F4